MELSHLLYVVDTGSCAANSVTASAAASAAASHKESQLYHLFKYYW